MGLTKPARYFFLEIGPKMKKFIRGVVENFFPKISNRVSVYQNVYITRE